MLNLSYKNSILFAIFAHVFILTCALLYKVKPPIEIINQTEIWNEEDLSITTPIAKTQQTLAKQVVVDKIQPSIKQKTIISISPIHTIAPKIIVSPLIIKAPNINHKIDIPVKSIPLHKKEHKLPSLPLTQPKMIESIKVAPIQNIKSIKVVTEKKDNIAKIVNKVEKVDKKVQKNNIDEIRKANLAYLMQGANSDSIEKTINANNKSAIKFSNKASSNSNSGGLSASYKAKVEHIIKRNIHYAGAKDNKLISVSLRIDSSGNILSKRIASSSGNASWDNSVLQAVEDSDPFPAPEDGVTISMTLNIRNN